MSNIYNQFQIEPGRKYSKRREKQVSGKLKLLNKLKQYLNEEAIKLVYNSLIRPLLTYNCLTNLYFSNTQIDKFKSLDKRTKHTASDDFEVNSIDLIYKRGLKMVKKCIDGKLCENFENYLVKTVHGRVTRNKVNLEFAKHGFYFQGVKLFNSLPIRIRQIEDFKDFMKELKSYSF